jgi:hypothetical protein
MKSFVFHDDRVSFFTSNLTEVALHGYPRDILLTDRDSGSLTTLLHLHS